MEIKKLKLKGGVKEDYRNEEQTRINDDFQDFNDLRGFVDTPPTYTPRNYKEQEVYYVNGATYRKYFYINNNWKYITLS